MNNDDFDDETATPAPIFPERKRPLSNVEAELYAEEDIGTKST
jgi:hypothetical protein